MGAHATLAEDQQQSVGTIGTLYLATEKHIAWRARSENGRCLLFTWETVARKAAVRRRQARQRSFQGYSVIPTLLPDDVAGIEAILKSACHRDKSISTNGANRSARSLRVRNVWRCHWLFSAKPKLSSSRLKLGLASTSLALGVFCGTPVFPQTDYRESS